MNMNDRRNIVRIIGIPIDLGQQHRGVDIGPVAIRYAGLSAALKKLGYHPQDVGNIDVPGHYTLTDRGVTDRLPLRLYPDSFMADPNVPPQEVAALVGYPAVSNGR